MREIDFCVDCEHANDDAWAIKAGADFLWCERYLCSTADCPEFVKCPYYIMSEATRILSKGW